jgi:hypothetical protein
MLKRYVYKNMNKRPVNIGGYQFKEGQELESNVLINGFNEAVSNGFLELTERDPNGAEPDATQAQQTGDTGKVKVIFHMGLDYEEKEFIKEIEVVPHTPIEFPDIDLIKEGEIFEGWFRDVEFTKPVNVDKAKSPKEGDIHFYGKIEVLKKENIPSESPDPINPNDGTGSGQKEEQVTLPPPVPTPPTGEKSTPIDPENK